MNKKSETIYFLTISGFLWIYLIYKAVVSPLVMDEATTFLEYSHLWDVLPGQANWRTNNHYLNSILVALSTSVFGIGEWSLRLPNLLAFLVFARYTWLWSRGIKSGLLRVLFPLTVFASLFYMEFFGLARGYGLSLAALYGGAYHQYRGLVGNTSRDKNLSFFFMILAIAANLNMQFIYLVWYAIELWDKRKVLKSNLMYLFVRLIPIVLTVIVSFMFKAKGSLDSGHDLGLLETFKSLLLVVGVKWNILWWSVPILMSIMVLTAFFIRAKKVKIWKWQPFDILIVFLLGNILVVLLNHFILGVSYPNQRLAMHWYLLWLPLLFLSANYFNSIGKYAIALMAIAFLGFQFNYWNSNFSTERNSDGIWQLEQIDKSFAKSLSEMRDPEITLSGSFYHHRQWAYLQLKNDAFFPLRMQHTLFSDTLSDFLLVKDSQKSEYPLYENFKQDGQNKLSLLKRKTLLSKKTVAEVDLDDIQLVEGSNLLIDGFRCPTEGKQIGVRFEFKMHADRTKFKNGIEILVTNNNGYKYWESFRLDKLFVNLENRQIVFNVIVPSQNEEELFFSIRFINIDGVKCSMDRARCYFYELE